MGRRGPGERTWSLPDLSAANGWERSPKNSRSLGWSPGGRYVLTLAEDDNWVAVTDADAGKEVGRLQGVTEAAIDADEQTIAYVKDGQVCVQSLAGLGGEGTKLGPGKAVAWRK